MDAERPGSVTAGNGAGGERHEHDPQVRLREAGLRATRPRVLVLELLEHLGGHRSADEVSAALAEAGQPLPRASVYNVLHDLTEHGLAFSADAGPGRALYEIATHWHHHFVCRQCGSVTDVPCVVGEKPCLRPGDGLDAAEIDEAQVIFRGRCARCSEAA